MGAMALASDGTNVFAVVIRGDAANSVSYAKYTVSAGTWGSWTDIQTSTQTRTNVGAYVLNGKLVATWAQANGGNYDAYNAALSVP